MIPHVDRRTAAIFLMGMAITAVFVAVVLGVFVSATKTTQIRDTQETNTAKSDQRDEVLQRIRNCTTPGRPCYERGQRQLRGAVSNVNQISIIAAACASKPYEQTVAQIQTCVLDRLAADAPD